MNRLDNRSKTKIKKVGEVASFICLYLTMFLSDVPDAFTSDGN